MTPPTIELATNGVHEVAFAEVEFDLRWLSSAHHQEASGEDPLAIDWPLLRTMADSGHLLTVIAHAGGALVGYCLLVIQPHVLFGEVWATQIALYMQPAHRGLLSLRLIRECETVAKEHGAKVLTQSVPHLSTAGALFERLGYGCRELVMAKRLD